MTGAHRVRTVDALGISLAALLVRLGFVAARSLWFDEAFSVWVAGQPWSEGLRFLRAQDPHPPLYYLILHLWLQLHQATPVMVRLPSVLFGAVLAGATALFASWAGGRRLGVAAGLLVATSGLAVQASVEARMYPLLGLLVVLSTFLLMLACASGQSLGAWAAYALITSLGLYTDYFAFLIIPVHCVYVLVFRGRSIVLRQRFLLALLAAVIAYGPWWPVLAEQYGSGKLHAIWKGSMPASAPLNIAALTAFGGYVLGFGGYLVEVPVWTWQQVAAVLPVLGVAAYGAWRMPNRPAGVLAAAGWVVPVALLITISLVTGVDYALPRYASFVYPFFAVLLAQGVLSLADRFGAGLRGRAVAALLGVLLLAGLNLFVLAHARGDPKFQVYNWAGAARHVEARWQEGDGVVFYPAPARVAFGYYFKKPLANAVTVFTPSWRVRLTREEWGRLVPPVHKQLGGAHRVWFVLTVPTPPGTAAALVDTLRKEYVRDHVADFGGIWVVLYRRR